MKYRELRDRLNALPDDILSFTATAYLRTADGEVMFPIADFKLTDPAMIDASRGSLKLTGEDYPLLVGNRVLLA